MNDSSEAPGSFDEITLVPEPSMRMLNERQRIDYWTEREHCLD